MIAIKVIAIKKKYLFFTLTVIHMILIFMFSSQNSDASSNTSHEFTRRILDMFLKNCSEKEIDKIVVSVDFFVRKAAHFSIYFVLGIYVYFFIMQFDLKSDKIILISVFICFLYGFFSIN